MPKYRTRDKVRLRLIWTGVGLITHPVETLKNLKKELNYEYVLATSIDEKMCAAALKGKYDEMKEYLHLGADINYKSILTGDTVLYQAISQGKEDIVDFLLDNGADPRIDSSNGPIICYVRSGLVPRLLNMGCDPNSQCYRGSVLSRHLEDNAAVQALLDKGTNPNMKGFMGRTPLHDAVFQGNAAVIKALLKAGADPLVVAEDRGTTVLKEAQHRHKQISEASLKNPAHYNDQLQRQEECLRIIEQAVKQATAKPQPPKLS